MSWLALVLGMGCSGTPIERPDGFVDPDLDETGAGPVLQLWRTPARNTLPQTVLPAGFAPTSRFPIEMEKKPARERKTTFVFRGPSPFLDTLQEEARVSAPTGMQLFAGATELQYSPNLAGQSWRLNGDQLLVGWKEEQVPDIYVSYPPVEKEVLRRDFQSAQLAPAEFVMHELTLQARTRHGLMLPAPASAEWDLSLPTGATFEAWLAISPLPLRTLTSDGAYASMTVIADGVETDLGRKFVEQDDEYARWRVDLSRWGGKQVTLRITTDPYSTPDFDYLFVGSPAIWGSPTGPVRRVVVIGIDTTRPDHFGFYGYERGTTPELDEVARTSVVFDHTWTPAPRTRPSFRSAFTGRRPLDAVGATNIGEVFQGQGFLTSGIVANVHLQPRFEFDEGFDDWWYDGQSKSDAQVDRALQLFEDYPDRDIFMFLHIMDPHLFYNAPASMRDMFVTDPDDALPEVFNRWDVYGWMRSGRISDKRKEHIKARYDAELRYTSQQLGRLFDGLDRLPGRSLVVLHSDHGEEFWEHGGFEHNHTVYEETVRGLLWFRSGPGQKTGQRISAPATLADIAPTLYELAGLTDVPPTDGRSLAPLLLGREEPQSFAEREIGVAHLRYGKERWGVVYRGNKYVLHTASGEEELYDLKADPAEQKNLALSTTLTPWREALARTHGMQVGRGWRVEVNLDPEASKSTYEISLPQTPVAVGVIDPEAVTEEPANTAWGERPKLVPADIGSVEVVGDKLVFHPGAKPLGGLLYVLFNADVDPSTVTISRGETQLVTIASRGKTGWRAGSNRIEVKPGTVVIPPLGEGPRMRALMGEDFDADEQCEMLFQLGYVTSCDEGKEGADDKVPEDQEGKGAAEGGGEHGH
jgi:arylsulfatase A-like enzyme